MRKLAILGFLAALWAKAGTAQEIAYGPDPKQRMDMYLPEQVQGAPVIVMLHGGGWRTGDKANEDVWKAKSEHWLAQGYIFISVNTRLVPQADPIEQARDLAAAMAMVQQLGAERGISPDQITLMGHSAGAHVAGLLAVRQELQRQAGTAPWNATVLLDTAALDVPAIMNNDPARLYRRAFGNDPDYWQASSPTSFLDRRDGSFLLVCSTLRESACPAARSFAETANAAGSAATVLPVQLSHAGINERLGQSNAYTRAVDRWLAQQ